MDLQLVHWKWNSTCRYVDFRRISFYTVHGVFLGKCACLFVCRFQLYILYYSMPLYFLQLHQQFRTKPRTRSKTSPSLLTEKLVQASLVATLQLEPFQEVYTCALYISTIWAAMYKGYGVPHQQSDAIDRLTQKHGIQTQKSGYYFDIDVPKAVQYHSRGTVAKWREF